MEAKEVHARYLRAAEIQFRLATAVRMASVMQRQPTDLPMIWSHGEHSVTSSEIAIKPQEVAYAAWNLQRTSTFLMASTVLEAIRAVFQNPRHHSDLRIANAYQIARMIRNAFAHSPLDPIWRIDRDCLGRVFEVPGVIKVDCNGLDGKRFNWEQYGGPLAILKLSRFVRGELFGDVDAQVEDVGPDVVYFLQGELVLRRIKEYQ